MPALPNSTDVLVVGAGPTGLTAALALQQQGSKVLLIDQNPSLATTSRAGVIHAHTLEVLAPLGVTPGLLERGLRLETFRIRNQNRVLVEIGFQALPSAYPFVLLCPQDETEAVLRDCLAAAGGTILRPVRLIGLRQMNDGVEAALEHEGATHRVTARWLLGCDGMHSAVREATGITFQGDTYEEDFILADLHMDWPIGREEVSLFFSPDGLMVVAPLPGDRFRVVATVEEAPHEPSLPYLQALVAERGPSSPGGKIHDVIWSARFRVHHRIAGTPLEGRVILCGDAAHVHSPAGGKGMNTGIQDAAALAGPLLAALNGEIVGLQAWAVARHQVAQKVIAQTDRLTRIATLSSRPARLLRDTALALAGHLPGLDQVMAKMIADLPDR